MKPLSLKPPIKETRIIVCGSRSFNDYKLMSAILSKAIAGLGKVVFITGGCGTGSDELAKTWAMAHGITVICYHAEWQEYGKSAGPRRNEEMIKESGSDRLLAFWDGHSKGTEHAIQCAKKHGLKVKVIYFDNGEHTDSFEPEFCCVCGTYATGYYQDREDSPSCGNPNCEIQMQAGIDFMEERET